MSSEGSTPSVDRVNTRFSTPAPELDDHRRRRHHPSEQSGLAPPSIEVQNPTPAGSILTQVNLDRVDDALRTGPIYSPVSIARDFEHAIVDDENAEAVEFAALPESAHRNSTRKRRLTNRMGRPRDLGRHDQSRDTSSSGSSSPANSIEAFAETRRRQRANTA